MSVDLGPGHLELPCLGRPFRLGMLYDCRSDTLIPSITLWDEEDLAKQVVTPQPSTNIDIFADDSIGTKLRALDIKGGLALSFLGGLMSVSGSAKYLHDQKSSNQQSRVTMKYNCTTEFKHLTMHHFANVQYHDAFNKGEATHVVTAIVYGAQAFFVFNQQFTDEEAKSNIEGELKAMVTKIPTIKIDVEGSLKMSEDDTKKVDKFEVKFHGDFIPTVNPTSFAEAVKLYQKLPQQLGLNNEKAVPVTVHLYPLENLDSKAAKLVREISVNLASQTQESIERLHSLSIRCSDLEKQPTCRNFPVIRDKVAKFHVMVKDYRAVFTKQLEPILPKIRGGSAEESELVQVLRQRESSPFSDSLLTQWLDNCEGLIKVMGTYIESMAPVKFASGQGDLLAETMNQKYRYCVCFTTHLNTRDSLVIAMKEYLRNCGDASYSPDPVSIPDTALLSDIVSDDMVANARHFTDLYKANTEATDITFIVVEDGAVTDKPGASIYLYEGGKPIDKNFKPPSAPVLLHETQVAHDELTIGWEEPNNGSENVTHYRISHKTSDASDWVVSNTTDAARGHVIHQLLPSTKYQVKVNAVCMAGSCEDNAVLTIITRPTNPPGKPMVWKVSALKIGIEWTRPNILEEKGSIHSYAIERCLISGEGNDEWTCCFSTQTGNQLSCDIHQGHQAPHRYRVIANCGKQDSLPSVASDEISIEAKSEEILKETIREGSKKVSDFNNPSRYQVELQEYAVNKSSKFRTRIFGNASPGVQEKVILIVGATGSGKTTFINGILNYILSVERNDNFRFILDDEGFTSNQAHSQTQWVTAYTLNHQGGFRIPYTLTMVDTPGFGDTRGIQRDKEIVKQLKEFFATSGAGGIDHIDIIGFLTQSALPRLTHPQKFVFDTILSIFGKDIGESIYLLITFADGQKPPVIASVKEAKLPYKKYYKFNNSALYASLADRSDGSDDENDDGGEGIFDERFWRMGVSSYKKFLNELTTITSKSLVLTNRVLEHRQRLENIVTEMQTKIKVGLNHLEQLKIEKDNLSHWKDIDIERNKSFTYKVRETTVIKKEIGLNTTYCLKCNFTCHEKCDIPINDDRSGCDAMTRPGHYCGVCPRNCHWSLHSNPQYTFEVDEREVTKTYGDLEERYVTAKVKTVSAETLMDKVLEDFHAVQMNVLSKTNELRKIIDQLEEIALKPNPLSTVDYIDILIESEKSTAGVGWRERTQHLKDDRRSAEIVAQVANDMYHPFEEYDEVVKEAKEKSSAKVGSSERVQQLIKLRKEAEILATVTKDGYDPYQEYEELVEEVRASEAEPVEEGSGRLHVPSWMREAGNVLQKIIDAALNTA